MTSTSTLPPPAKHPNSAAATSSHRIIQKRWVCDVCQVKWFLDFDEACRHEASCQSSRGHANDETKEAAPSSVISQELDAVENNNSSPIEIIHIESDDSCSKKCKETEEIAPRRSKRVRRQSSLDPVHATTRTETNRVTASNEVAKTSRREKGGAIPAFFRATDAAAPCIVSREEYEQHVMAEKLLRRKLRRGGEAKSAMRSTKETKAVEMSKRKQKRADVHEGSKATISAKSACDERGLSQNLLAEDAAATFFAKRKQAAREERERQKKRDEARRFTRRKDDDKLSAVEDKKSLRAERREKMLEAVRFPCPSHVLQNNDVFEKCATMKVTMGPKYPSGKVDLTSPFPEEPMPDLTFFGNDWDDVPSKDLTMRLFSSAFLPSNPRQKDSRLWTDKYTMTQIPSSVLGASNRESSQKLMRFIEDWKSRRHKSRLRKKSKKRKSGYDSDDSFLDGENSSPTAVFVITGRTGTGKSRLVHAVSAGLDCALLEISTGEVRGGGALKKRLMESTLSHSSVALMKRREPVTVLAAESKKEFFDEESDSEEEEEERSSLTVILIDEVDLLFQDHGDTGFWLALSQLSQKAKSPIVLTATSMPHELLSGTIKFEHIELHRPSIEECCAKMKEVAEAESMVLKRDASGNSGLSLIAEYFQCDIRRILNEMQLFHFSTTNRSSSADVVVFTRDWKTKSEDCSVDVDSEEEPDRPVILNIDPLLIPRDCYTLITIQGKNFQRTESATLYFGGEVCRHFSVVSDSKILAVCPPLLVPDGISSGLKYQKSPYGHVINCLSTKFVKVVVRKRCSNGLFLDSTSCLPPHRSNWNIEYDVSLECSLLEQKLSRKEFIRKAKAQRKRLENAAEDGFFSSEEEFELEGDMSNSGHPIIDTIAEDLPSNIELRKNYGAKETEVSSSSPMRNVDPQVLLNEALSELMIEQSNEESTDNTTYANGSSTFHELHTFAEEMGRLSDVAFLEDGLLGVPMLAGAVEGIGSQSIGDFCVESMPTDPSVDKLCNEKKKPPSFESLYMSGLTEEGFFFGDADAYMTYPCRQRERSLLSNTELYSRGIGALDSVIEQEPPGKETSETTNDEFEQSDLERISSRIQSEDDMFIFSQPPATLLLVPALLGNLMQDTAAFYRSNIANEPWLHQRMHAMSSKMFGVMSTILVPENSAIEHDWNKICFGFRRNERFTTEMAQTSRLRMCNWSFDHTLALDYLPYLRFIARNENRVRLVSEDMMNGLDETTRNSRTSKRRKQHLRAHYLEEFCGKYGNQERLRQDVRDLGDSYLSGHWRNS